MQENQIVISAQDIDFSTSAEETQVCQYAGAAMSISFKSTFPHRYPEQYFSRQK